MKNVLSKEIVERDARGVLMKIAVAILSIAGGAFSVATLAVYHEGTIENASAAVQFQFWFAILIVAVEGFILAFAVFAAVVQLSIALPALVKHWTKNGRIVSNQLRKEIGQAIAAAD